jgi:hypothetical protein
MTVSNVQTIPAAITINVEFGDVDGLLGFTVSAEAEDHDGDWLASPLADYLAQVVFDHVEDHHGFTCAECAHQGGASS